jgi:hypothetical protein
MARKPRTPSPRKTAAQRRDDQEVEQKARDRDRAMMVGRLCVFYCDGINAVDLMFDEAVFLDGQTKEGGLLHGIIEPGQLMGVASRIEGVWGRLVNAPQFVIPAALRAFFPRVTTDSGGDA